MLVLALIAGRAYGGDVAIPFLSDWAAFGRHLVALPLLVLIHPVIDRETARTIVNLRESGLVRPGDDPLLLQKLERARQLWKSPFVRLLLVAVTVLAAVMMGRLAVSFDAPDWLLRTGPGGPALSAAGWWNLAIAGPLFRLFVLFALWKLMVWSWFLLQLSRMPLNYQVLHADRCGGLGIFERVQIAFSGLAAALAVQFGCIIADAVLHKGHELASFRLPAIVFVVLMLVLFLAPLTIFVRPLSRACVRAELAFHAWFSRASTEVESSLEQKSDKAAASQLASPEFSSLTDATTLYAGALSTRRIPITRRSLIVVLASVIPMVLPLLPLLPLREIGLRLVKVVL